MGHDAALRSGEASPELWERLREQDRRYVTNSARRAEEARKAGVAVLELAGRDTGRHLRELIEAAGIEPELRFDRCSLCNEPLEAVDPSELLDDLPPMVRDATDRFQRCPVCGRVYWELSHVEDIRERFRRLLGG